MGLYTGAQLGLGVFIECAGNFRRRYNLTFHKARCGGFGTDQEHAKADEKDLNAEHISWRPDSWWGRALLDLPLPGTGLLVPLP